MEQKFYICKHCGNIIAKIKDMGVPVICCGEPMTEIVPGTTDAAVEKHVPVWTVENGIVHVKVGSVEHPMLPEHYIEWVSPTPSRATSARNCIPVRSPRSDSPLRGRRSRRGLRLLQPSQPLEGVIYLTILCAAGGAADAARRRNDPEVNHGKAEKGSEYRLYIGAAAESLRPISRCALTTVVAPMGYGKTTAVNWYLAERAGAEAVKIVRISVYSDNLAIFWRSAQDAFARAWL